MTQRVNIQINVSGNANAQIGQINAALSQLGRQNLGGSLFANFTAANVAARAIVGTVGLLRDALSTAADGLVAALQRADESMTSIIAQAGGVAYLAGVTPDEGIDITRRLAEMAERMGAALPGTAEQFRVTALSALDESLVATMGDIDAALQSASEVSQLVVLAAQGVQGLTERELGTFARQLVTPGTSIAQMLQTTVGRTNQALLTIIENVTEEMFGTEFDNLDQAQRIAVVRRAREIAYPESIINALGTTLGSSVNRIMTELFGEFTGLFSFTRDLFPEAEGMQNIITAVSGVVRSLYDAILALAGISRDESGNLTGEGIDRVNELLRGVYRQIMRFDSWLGQLAHGIRNIGDAGERSRASESIREFLDALDRGIPTMLAHLTNVVVRGLNDSLAYVDVANAGAMMGDAVGQYLANIDPAPFAELLLKGTIFGIAALGQSIASWVTYSLTDAWTVFLENTVNEFNEGFAFITDLIRGVFDALRDPLNLARLIATGDVLLPLRQGLQSAQQQARERQERPVGGADAEITRALSILPTRSWFAEGASPEPFTVQNPPQEAPSQPEREEIQRRLREEMMRQHQQVEPQSFNFSPQVAVTVTGANIDTDAVARTVLARIEGLYREAVATRYATVVV